jgi:hypothetical protein
MISANLKAIYRDGLSPNRTLTNGYVWRGFRSFKLRDQYCIIYRWLEPKTNLIVDGWGILLDGRWHSD